MEWVPPLKLILYFLIPAFLFITLKSYTDFKVAQAEKKYPPLGKFVLVEGLKMHVLQEGKGKPVVLIHGGFGSIYDFKLSLLDHVSKCYQAIAIDRPGHGYSARPSDIRMYLSDHARYMRDSVRALGVAKSVLVGHSLGAAIGLAYAIRYPDEVAGLVLIGAYVTPFKGPTNPIHTLAFTPLIGSIYLQTLLQPLGRLIGRDVLDKVFFPEKPPSDYVKAARDLTLRPAHFKANAEDICNLNEGLRSIMDKYHEVKVPTVLITGNKDLVAPREVHADKLKAVIPQARLIILEGVGHRPDFSRPQSVMEAIDWVWKQTETRA